MWATFALALAVVCLLSVTEGRSPPYKIPCIVTMEHNPMCGKDGITYPNPSSAKCAGVEIDHPGQCDCKLCKKKPSPVCGADGKTYANPCLANCVGVLIDRPGKCNCVCNKMYSPVCGVDGKTYGNPCTADCAGIKIRHKGECKKYAG